MCGVIGVILESPSDEDFQIIKNIFVESKIRGLHATGISYVKNGKIVTIKEPISSDKFVEKYFTNKEIFIDDNHIMMIGHCRYSTSDLEFNQPISNDSFSIVHNGVVTQEPYESWRELYGYDCVTKNDTELLFHTILDNHDPLWKWKDSSLSCIELNEYGLRFYRNEKRPLYYTRFSGGYIITSTKDIVKRSGISSEPNMTIPNEVYFYGKKRKNE